MWDKHRLFTHAFFMFINQPTYYKNFRQKGKRSGEKGIMPMFKCCFITSGSWQQYYQRCDNFVKKWLGIALLKQQFSDDAYHQDLEFCPGLFLGDPENCSVVTINLNPGAPCGVKPLNIIQKLVNSNGYSYYAKRFDYLAPPTKIPNINDTLLTQVELNSFNQNYNGSDTGVQWWQKRNQWLTRLFSNCQKKPFALELSPWSSSRWNVHNILEDKKILRYLGCYVIAPAIKATKTAVVPLIVCVGKTIADVLEKFDFRPLKGYCWCDRNPCANCAYWPKNKTNNNKNIVRTYRLLYNATYDCLALCVWTTGNNTTPSPYFTRVETCIFNKIQQLISSGVSVRQAAVTASNCNPAKGICINTPNTPNSNSTKTTKP